MLCIGGPRAGDDVDLDDNVPYYQVPVTCDGPKPLADKYGPEPKSTFKTETYRREKFCYRNEYRETVIDMLVHESIKTHLGIMLELMRVYRKEGE